jgi:hypothetical protein
MAVLGSATIVVRAITTGVKDDLKGAFADIAKDAEASGKRVSNSFNKGLRAGSGGRSGGGFFDDVARGIRRLQNSSKGALRDLNMLEGKFLNLGTVLTSVGGGIGALISSLVSLVGVLGAVGASSIAAVGALASLGVGAFATKFALGGVGAAISQATKTNGGYKKSIKEIREELQQLRFDAKDAELTEREAALNVEKARENLLRMADLPPNSMARREAELQYDQAEQAYKRAKDRASDLNDQLKDGIDPTKGAGAGTDPYAGLTKSQKEFAQRIVELKPIFQSLKEEIAKGFLPELGNGIERATDILDKRLRPSLGKLGDSLGRASDNFFDVILSDKSVTMFERFIDKSGPRVEKFGSIFGNLFEAIFGLLDAAGPLIDKFVGWLEGATKKVSDFFSGGADDPKLIAFFESVGETAALVGDIFGNLFGGLGVLIETTTGPGSGGEYLLTWIRDITEGFQNMSIDEKGELRQFFLDSAVNAQKFLQALGAIFGVFADIGADPALGEAFDTIAKAAPFIEDILRPLVDNAPILAETFVLISEIVSLLVDDATVKAFFTTIRDIVTAIRDFLAGEEVQAALKEYGPLIAQVSAAFFAFEKVKPVFQAVTDGISQIGDPLANLFSLITGGSGKGGIGGAVQVFGDLIKQPGGFMKALKGAGIVGLIVLIVTKIVEFYNKFEDFRKRVDDTIKAVAESFGSAFEEIGQTFEKLFGDGTEGSGLMGAIDPLLKFILEFVIPILGNAFRTFASVIELIFGLINTVLDAVIAPIKAIVDGIMMIFEGDFQGGMEKIFQGIGGLIVGIFQSIVNGVIDLINFGLRQFQNFIQTIGNTPVGDFLKTTFGVDLKNFKVGPVEKVNWVNDMMAVKTPSEKARIAAGATDAGRRNVGRQMAEGGIVSATAGGVLATIGEGGKDERVEPLDPSGLSQRDRAMIQMLSGGGPVINVYPPPGANESEIAEMVSRRLAREMGRGKF